MLQLQAHTAVRASSLWQPDAGLANTGVEALGAAVVCRGGGDCLEVVKCVQAIVEHVGDGLPVGERSKDVGGVAGFVGCLRGRDCRGCRGSDCCEFRHWLGGRVVDVSGSCGLVCV